VRVLGLVIMTQRRYTADRMESLRDGEAIGRLCVRLDVDRPIRTPARSVRKARPTSHLRLVHADESA
jgi:hypothetical protein